MQLKNLILLITLIFSYSCAIFDPEPRKDLFKELPSQYSLFSENKNNMPQKWWKTFNKPELNKLIDKALNENFSIREAWARLNQAKAELAKYNSWLWPYLNGEAGSSLSTTNKNNASGSTSQNYRLGLGAGYEVDIWGHNRSNVNYSKLLMQSQRAEFDATAIVIAENVSKTWVDIISTNEELRLLNEQIKTNKTILELLHLSFAKSFSTYLDVLQQTEVVARVKATFAPIEERKQLLKNSLAILIGKPTGKNLDIKDKNLPKLSPLPKIGIPTDLLAQRPDVKAAGLRLKASDWQVSAKKAERLPMFNITGSSLLADASINNLLNTWILNLAANITGPIFDGGRRKAEVERVKAIADERLQTYKKVVYNAIKQVEDRLISELKQKEHIKALEYELTIANYALKEAEDNYRNGLITFTPLLTELINVQKLQRNMIVQKAILIKNRISLYASLGGDWTKNISF